MTNRALRLETAEWVRPRWERRPIVWRGLLELAQRPPHGLPSIGLRTMQRQLGELAHREAVIVTSHGRDDVVLLSAEEYQRLRSLDRRAMRVSELTDEDPAALDAVEIPAEAARYNHEMT